MLKRQQMDLLGSIINNVKSDLMDKVEHFPDDWDGFEIRRYIAEKFMEEARGMDRARMRKYRNDVRTRPL